MKTFLQIKISEMEKAGRGEENKAVETSVGDVKIKKVSCLQKKKGLQNRGG